MSKLHAYLNTKPALTRATVGYMVRGNRVLLGVRKRVSHGLGQSLIAGIGGKLEPGETDEQALKRECMEEIKISITSYKHTGDVVYLFPHKPQWNQQVSLFIITEWDGDPRETEDIEPLWVNQSHLPKERMWPDNLYTIPAILAGETFEGAFLYRADGGIEEYSSNVY